MIFGIKWGNWELDINFFCFMFGGCRVCERENVFLILILMLDYDIFKEMGWICLCCV